MTDILAEFGRMLREDVDACNLIGVKACITCQRNKVPNVDDRQQCIVCIKNDAVREAVQ